MRRETRREPRDAADMLYAALGGKPRNREYNVIAFSEADRKAFARVARIMRRARELMNTPETDLDYEMARVEHGAQYFSEMEHVWIEED